MVQVQESEQARQRVENALESMIAVCMNLQDTVFSGEAFDSPEAMRDFREEVRVTLKTETDVILSRLDQFFSALDKETIY